MGLVSIIVVEVHISCQGGSHVKRNSHCTYQYETRDLETLYSLEICIDLELGKINNLIAPIPSRMTYHNQRIDMTLRKQTQADVHIGQLRAGLSHVIPIRLLIRGNLQNIRDHVTV